MEDKLKPLSKSLINKIRNSQTRLKIEDYGKLLSIKDYTEREISEMYYGIYKEKKMLLTDDDLFINLNEIISSSCILENVSYYKKPTKENLKNNSHNIISNIRTFYIKDYFLISESEIEGLKKHKITKYLYKIGFLNKGRGKFSELFSIANDYQTLQYGIYPKDLFHPIKRYINGMFFNDDYAISEFKVVSDIKIESGN